VDSTFVLVDHTRAGEDGGPAEAEGTLVVAVPASVVEEADLRARAEDISSRVDWEKVLAESVPERTPSSAAAVGGVPTSAPGWAQDDPRAASSHSTGDDTPRHPLPWEDEGHRAAPTSQGKSGSGGKRRRMTSDSSQDSPDSPTGAARRRDDDPDDGLPPLPDFLKED
jgi:hypothetical protein